MRRLVVQLARTSLNSPAGLAPWAMVVWLMVLGCASTPMTHRRQLLLVPEPQEMALGVSAFSEILASEPPSTNGHFIELVDRVGRRLAAAANRPDYDWEFRVLASPQQNAFCLPGGKVAIYEGILPVCQSEAGLAVVMAHEVAHALARHGGERMSQSYVVDAFGRLVSHLNATHEVVSNEQLNRAYGIVSEYGFVLPYSRKHESEADQMGVMLMAQAGYDPREAPKFWERFAQWNAGPQTVEFLSTHPSDARRSADLLELLPEALAIYERSAPSFGLGEMIQLEGSSVASPASPQLRDAVSLTGKAASVDSAPGGRNSVVAAGVAQLPPDVLAVEDGILPPPTGPRNPLRPQSR